MGWIDYQVLLDHNISNSVRKDSINKQHTLEKISDQDSEAGTNAEGEESEEVDELKVWLNQEDIKSIKEKQKLDLFDDIM